MSGPGQPEDGNGGVHLEAAADGQASVNQAGRDLHVHYAPGVRRVAETRDGVDAVCPYPGLAAFTEQQAQWFFGRDRVTAGLLGRLNDCLIAGGPLMVVAASGAGKSSLLKAGLLHEVAQGRLTWAGSRHWPRVVFTPTAHPVREAARRLAALPGMAGGSGMPADPGPEDLDGLLRGAVEAVAGRAGPGARAVIAVDQFEELFTLCDSSGERDAFISWLWRAAGHDADGGPLALVACGLRADFYSQCLRYPLLGQALQEGQVLVGPMSEDELREAICHPAREAGLDIEPGLVEVLLRDLRAGHDSGSAAVADDLAAGYDAGRLPLLAYALQATWQNRHGSTLTLDGYRAAGGIEHAIAETAEKVFARLDDAGQREARALFLRLVKIGASSGEDVRRPVSRPALASGGSPAAAVLDAYVASRLLTSARDAVQITHEALLTAWPRLRGWLDGDRAGHLIRQDLEDSAAGWDHGGGDSSLLYRGARLETAAAWADGHDRDLTQAARRFLAASRRLARRTRALRLTLVAALAVLALAASAFSGVALHLRATADQQRDLAVYNQVLAEGNQRAASNPSLSAQLLYTAYRMRPSRDLASRLIGTENQPLPALITTGSSPLHAAAVSPDGRTLAAVNAYGTLRLWNITRPTRPLPIGRPLKIGGIVVDLGASSITPQVAFSPDGRTLAAITADTDFTIVLWDIADPARPRELGHPLPASGAAAVVFSPDGRTLAAINTDTDGTIVLWDIADPARPRELGDPLATGANNTAYPAAFSPDGRTLATSNLDGTIGLWDIADPARPRELRYSLATGTSNLVSSAAFSPDGHTIAVGSSDGTILLYDVTSPASPSPLVELPSSGDNGASLLVFSPDGHTLAVGRYGGTTSLWDVTSPASPVPLGQLLAGGSSSPVLSVAFSRDGRTLAIGGYDGTISVWTRPSTTLATNSANGRAGNEGARVVLSPDGRTLAAINPDGTIGLWDVTDPARPREVAPRAGGTGGPVVAVFSPDSRTLAAGSSHGRISLWNVASPAHPVPIGQPLASGSSDVNFLAFSQDGRTLAVGGGYTLAADGYDYRISLWNVTNPARPRELGPPLATGGGPVSLAFSTDGRTLVLVSWDGTVSLRNVTYPARPRELGPLPDTGASAATRLAAVSPDGRILAAVSTDGKIWLRNVTGPRRPVPAGQPLTTTAGDVSALAVSPDDRTLAAGGYDGTISLWNITDPARPVPLGQPMTAGSSPVVSLALSKDGRTLASGSFDGTTQLWNLDVRYAINRICATTSLTSHQWHLYIPELPYNPPCPQ